MKITITKNRLTYAVIAVGCTWALLHSFCFGTHMVYYMAPDVHFHLNGQVWFVLLLTLIAVVAVQLRWRDTRPD